MKKTEPVEMWVSPSGRQIPTRDATRQDAMALPITAVDLKDANENDIFGCAIAMKGGMFTNLPTKEAREEWGQGVWWNVAIFAVEDPEAGINGRIRIRYRIRENLAKLVDKVRKNAKPQMVHFDPFYPSKARKHRKADKAKVKAQEQEPKTSEEIPTPGATEQTLPVEPSEQPSPAVHEEKAAVATATMKKREPGRPRLKGKTVILTQEAESLALTNE